METTVLVTGSSGLLGERICRELSADHFVVGLDRRPPRGERPDMWLGCDLTDDASVHTALAEVRELRGAELASVVHLAAHYDFSGEPSPLYTELTVEGTRRLLRELRHHRVGQLVFASSLLVMKAATEEGQVLDEDSEVEAEWDYPESKLRAEHVLLAEREGIPVVVLRIAGVYDEDCHSVPIAQQMRRIHERKLESHLFPGNPDHGQSFVHLDDVAAAVRASVERRRRLEPFETFLVGEPDVVSYGELQDRMGAALHGREWTTLRVPAVVAKAGAWLRDQAPGDDPFIKPWMIDLADAHLPVSIERAEQQLGWRPRHRLRDAIPEMCRRLAADPERWYRENGLEAPADLAPIDVGDAGDAGDAGGPG